MQMLYMHRPVGFVCVYQWGVDGRREGERGYRRGADAREVEDVAADRVAHCLLCAAICWWCLNLGTIPGMVEDSSSYTYIHTHRHTHTQIHALTLRLLLVPRHQMNRKRHGDIGDRGPQNHTEEIGRAHHPQGLLEEGGLRFLVCVVEGGGGGVGGGRTILCYGGGHGDVVLRVCVL